MCFFKRKSKTMANTRLRKVGGAFTVAGALAIGLVGAWEGLRTVAYRDIVGVPTVCFGETRGVEMGDEYTVEECQVMLGEGLIESRRYPREIVRRVSLALLQHRDRGLLPLDRCSPRKCGEHRGRLRCHHHVESRRGSGRTGIGESPGR